ncbi:cytochrome P450 [Nesterenkonia lacusekhoensis]|uniref:Cytochrome P450 n=1 Tax=Nesterenkonia lacusekhoensis TaxID=150832 RepID=A0ABS4T451_9MICC|nr:cytochrome P450 [Nesterenkonia lacusekhoensis]
MTQRSQSQQHIPDGSREVPEGQHAVTAPACAEGPTSVQNPLPRLTLAETAQVVGEVQLPTIAKGPILRRPKMVAGVERLGLEARAVKRMHKVSEKYGSGPVMLNLPGKRMAMVLDPEHCHRVLEETPEPFAPGEMLKRNALKHFEPKVSLISHDEERAERRRLNEEALGHDHPIHHAAAQFMPIVQEEAQRLLKQVERDGGRLGWEPFHTAWQRVVRRVVLGDSWADDAEFTELMESLRASGNWAFLKPVPQEDRDELIAGIRQALEQAEPGSLAAHMAEAHGGGGTESGEGPEAAEPENQVPQWLFAFDPAGMATFRALALLAAHPDRLDAARLQVSQESGAAVPELRLLRASVLESLRLWATTPMILRETTMEVEFDCGVLPAGTSTLIFAPYFHRDERHLEFAHHFAPEIWDRPRGRDEWPLMPFSMGTGICPGRHLVLLLTSNFLAQLVDDRCVELTSHELTPGSLPALLNNYGLEFRLS